MPVIILDTGILYDLVASKILSAAALKAWSAPTKDVWVPPSVRAELQYRTKRPEPSVPPELPGKALGLIGSSKAGFAVIEAMTAAEAGDVATLQVALGSAARHAGESEAVVLAARRAPDALVLLDDMSAIDELATYFQTKTGAVLKYQRNIDLIGSLVAQGHLTAAEAAQTKADLRGKKRPFV